MEWFGTSWGASVCDPADHVVTPVGAECGRCSVVIVDGDRGFVLPVIHGERTESMAMHLRCFTASVGVGDADP